jgi:hypothetical protein
MRSVGAGFHSGLGAEAARRHEDSYISRTDGADKFVDLAAPDLVAVFYLHLYSR